MDTSFSAAFTESPPNHKSVLCVSKDTVVPPLSATCVSVACFPTTDGTFDATVEPVHLSCIKRNVVIPYCTLSVVHGRTSLWTVNCSSEPAILPEGLKLAAYHDDQVLSLAILTEAPDSSDERRFVNACPAADSSILTMVNKSLSTNQRQEVANILVKHAGLFDFSKQEGPPSFPLLVYTIA